MNYNKPKLTALYSLTSFQGDQARLTEIANISMFTSDISLLIY
jgi:hypothetical protein